MADKPTEHKDEENEDTISKNKWYHIGAIIFLLAMSVYSFYSPSLIDEGELTTIEGKVIGKPYHYTHHDNPEYIKIEVEGQSKPFRIKGCALHSSYKQALLELDNYDRVKFHVSKEELSEKVRPLISSLVEVYAFSVNDNIFISLADFNNCRKVTWKRFLILLPIAGLTMLLSLWKRKSR